MRSAWVLILPLLVGCSGKNVVAGGEKTKQEQLTESLPSWCRTTCERLAVCATQEPCNCSSDSCSCKEVDVEDCTGDCQKDLKKFADDGEACAELGQRYLACLDDLSCDALDGRSCEPTKAQLAACPSREDQPPSAGPSGSGGSGISVGGSTGGSTFSGTAGSAPSYAGSSGGSITFGGTGPGAGGEPSYAGTAPSTGGAGGVPGGGGAAGGGSREPVSCESIDEGGAGSGSSVTCDASRTKCSDGHDYSWVCASGSNQQLGCSCFVDGQFSGGFDPGAKECPSLARVNEACGFSIVE